MSLALRTERCERVGMKAAWTLYNRYTGKLEPEQIYGEAWLRRAYETPVGRFLTWAVAKRTFFSRWYGQRMQRPSTIPLIEPFIDAYGIDRDTFADPVTSFACFNDFFIRRLKPEARPVDPDPSAIVFPADGRHLLLPRLDAHTRLWAKGEGFELEEFVGSEGLARTFRNGAAVVSRLAPVDYHRFHFPISGRASAARLINGPLYSVHPIALARSTRYLTANKRTVTLIENEGQPPVAMVEIGATNVGSIDQTYTPGPVVKGEEKGYFAFGGSCVVTIFAEGSASFAGDLAEHSGQGREIYAHVGDRMGQFAQA